MTMNTIQFQKGMSLLELHAQFGSEAQCETALEKARWPSGFQCPSCGHHAYYILTSSYRRKTFQCRQCEHQTSIIAGTLFEGTKLALTVWFLGIYLISQAKTGLSSLALKRQLGVSYRTAWLMKHKLMQAMVDRDKGYTLSGFVQVDDVYLGGELPSGKAGRGSENKVPFVAAVSLNDKGHPMYMKLSPVAAFTREAIKQWAEECLEPNAMVLSDGLSCFNGVTDAQCHHQVIVAGGRKPRELPEFKWANTIIGNVKTSLSGAYHSFKFGKYLMRYLGEIGYRFNRRFNLEELPMRLVIAAVSIGPYPERMIRLSEAPT